jgi:hypothetical protein
MAERRRFAGALAAALLLASCGIPMPSLPSLPRDAAFELETRYWQAEPNGHVAVDAGANPGTSTNAALEHRLALDGERELTFDATLDLGEHRLSAEYLPLSFSGSGRTGRAFTFHGEPFPAGDDVSSDLELETWVVKWDYALSKERRTKDAFRVGLGAWWWDFDLDVEGSPSGIRESRQFSRVYPGAHASITMELGEGTTLDLSGAMAANSYHRRLYDWSAEIAYHVSDYVFIGAGYRWLIWDFNETTNDGDFDFKGPFAAMTLRF